MDWLTRKLTTIDDHVNVLPESLRALVRRELDAGNTIAEAGTGFPAPPVGVWVKLAKPFLTSDQPPPEGVTFRIRPHHSWPAEFTDEPRHHFVICEPGEVKLAPRPKPVEPPRPPEPPPRTPASTFDRDAYADPAPRPVLPDQGQAAINAAIERHLGLWWTPEKEAAVAADVGSAGLALVKEIAAWAEAPEFWQYADQDGAYRDTQARLRERYPFLSPAAVQRLANRAAYGWK